MAERTIVHQGGEDDLERLRALGSALATREDEDADAPEPAAREDLLDTDLELHPSQLHDPDAAPIARPEPAGEEDMKERLVARTAKGQPRFNTIEILPPYRFSV